MFDTADNPHQAYAQANSRTSNAKADPRRAQPLMPGVGLDMGQSLRGGPAAHDASGAAGMVPAVGAPGAPYGTGGGGGGEVGASSSSVTAAGANAEKAAAGDTNQLGGPTSPQGMGVKKYFGVDDFSMVDRQ